MKFQAALLVVKNMERSVKFYKEVLGLEVTIGYWWNYYFNRRSSVSSSRKLV